MAIKLTENLKYFVRETFWSPALGEVILTNVMDDFMIIKADDIEITVFPDGSFIKGEMCLLFPSKNNRDWEKWIRDTQPPKTWSVLEGLGQETELSIGCDEPSYALMKILRLIEYWYGGVVTQLDRETTYYALRYNLRERKPEIDRFTSYPPSPIRFHTLEQAKEFIGYQENVELLKTFFMI